MGERVPAAAPRVGVYPAKLDMEGMVSRWKEEVEEKQACKSSERSRSRFWPERPVEKKEDGDDEDIEVTEVESK